jgi:predicted rRNA methylase
MSEQIEGRNAVLEAFRSGKCVDKLFVLDRCQDGPVRTIVREARKKDTIINFVPKERLDQLSETGAHQGVIAQVAAYEYSTVEDILEKAREKGEAPFIFLLDDIEDPHNLGAIIRTANLAGAHGVIIPKRHAAGLTSVVAKTSAGALNYTPVAKVSNLSQTIEELKKEGMQEEAAEGLTLFPEEEVVPYLPQFVREQEETVSGTTRGSAYHRLLEIFPFERQETWTAAKIRTVIEECKADRRLSEEYAAAINVYKIRAFLQTPLAARMAKAAKSNRLHREQPFVLGLSANRLNTDFPEDETVLIQGIIDVYLEEEDGIVLADYKTDLVKDPKELILRYRVQLDYYEEALVRLTGKCVKEKLIYSFGLEQEITL